MKIIKQKNNLNSTVSIPGSKSLTHRALITAGLADGKSTLRSFLSCEDTLYTASTLQKLGINIDVTGNIAIVHGNGGRFHKPNIKQEIDLGNSGTSYRLLLSIAALANGEYLFTGSERMKARPVAYLVNALSSLGVDAGYLEKDGYPPVLINASGIKGGRVKVAGEISSQYISSLLLSGPYAESDVTIEIDGELVSKPYIDLTLDVMASFGVIVEHEDYHVFHVPAGQLYRARELVIEGDVSSASYFWGAAAITGGRVKTENIYPFKTLQGDIGLLKILKQMGCSVTRKDNSVTVNGGRLSGINVDMGAMPDMVPTLAVIALFAEGKTEIVNVPHLRHKESDRIADTANEIRRMGGRIEEKEDGLIIYGGEKLHGAEIDPHNDHRLAMSFAMAGLKIPGIVINNENCVIKSFPTFWELWEAL
ncbi:MAG: 3-phosphoshikimate 1-carboxyvinyltransferase [Deltaproteobacteria bacterium]|nr:3-phosphoshikimate 1-carboxyvinyltransferase [Deltaproteobacteria bacterium]